jgi:toxin HigB-1
LEIDFKSGGLRKTFNAEKELKKTYGDRMAKTIMNRMALLRAAPALADVSHEKPIRRHQLSGDRSGEFAVDLVHPHRLVFQPAHDPVPKRDDGGINLQKVTAIKILGVEGYH